MATLTVACVRSFVNADKRKLTTFDPSYEIRTRDFSNRLSRCSVLPKHAVVQPVS